MPQPPSADPLKLAIGELVFADPRLSSDGSRACSSCHDIGTNGADGNQHDKAMRFINTQAHDLDVNIDQALAEMAQCVGADRATSWPRV